MAITSITKDFVVKAGITVEGTRAVSTSTSTSGTLQVNGGAAIAKNLIVGSTATLFGATTILSTLNVDQTATFSSLTATTVAINQTLLVGTTSTFNGNLIVYNTASDTTNNLNNAVYVAGGVGIAGILKVTSSTLLSGVVTIDNATDSTSTNTGALVLSNGGISVAGQSQLAGNLTVGGITQLNNTLLATSSGTAALVVTGGEYIGGNLIVASTATSYTNTNSNSIYTQGGVGIARDLIIGGSAVISGSLSVLGTQTIINSTSTAIQDPVIDIGTGPNNSPLVVNDGYNKGLVIHYYDVADNHMFLGRAVSGSSAGHLILRNNIDPGRNGIIPNQDYVNSGSWAVFDTGAINLFNTGTAVSASTGVLNVAGGIGVGDNVWVQNGVNASTLTGRALSTTTQNLVYADTNGQLQLSSFSLSGGQITGSITTASNLSGGALGSIPYQSSAGVTTFVSIGSETTVLTVVNGLPAWKSANGTTVGNASYAVTATNIAGGIADQIPYQSATSSTTFSTGLTFNGTTFTATNVSIPGTTNAISTLTGALQVAGGVGIQKNLWVGGDVNIGGTLFFNGVGADQVTSNTGTFVNVSVTGTGVALTVTNSVFVGQNLQVNNSITATSAIFTGIAQSVSTTSGTLQVIGGVGVGGNLVVGGNITGTSINITGQSVLGLVTATAVTATSLSVSGPAYLGGTTATNLNITGTTDSTLPTNGSIVTQGGIGVAKSIVVGGSITVGATTASTVVNSVFSNNTVYASYTSGSITTNSQQTLDNYSSTAYRTAKYLVQIVDGVNVHVEEILVFHDGSNVYITEYAIASSTGELGSFGATINGGLITLTFTPNYTPSAMVIKTTRTAITI